MLLLPQCSRVSVGEERKQTKVMTPTFVRANQNMNGPQTECWFHKQITVEINLIMSEQSCCLIMPQPANISRYHNVVCVYQFALHIIPWPGAGYFSSFPLQIKQFG